MTVVDAESETTWKIFWAFLAMEEQEDTQETGLDAELLGIDYGTMLAFANAIVQPEPAPALEPVKKVRDSRSCKRSTKATRAAPIRSRAVGKAGRELHCRTRICGVAQIV